MQERLGRPTLTTIDAIAQSLALGPIFSSIMLAALVAGAAGAAAPLAMLIAVVGCLALGWIVSLYARRYHGCGAIYDYVRLGVNPSLGLFVAAVYFLGTMTLGSFPIYAAAGVTLAGFLGTMGINLTWVVAGIICAVIIFLLNHFGIQVAVKAQLTLTVLSVLPLLLIAGAILLKGGAAGHDLSVFIPAGGNTGLFTGVLLAITLFIGFEAAASLGEETANPRESIPKAIFGTVAIVGLFYLIMVYSSDIGFGTANAEKWATDASPMATLAAMYVGDWLAPLVDIALLLDILAVASAFMATSARGMFALARHGLLPRFLAVQTSRGTPFGGNATEFLIAVVTMVLIASTGADGITALAIGATAGGLLIELIYIVLALGAARFLVAARAPWWQWIVLAVATVTPALGIYGSVVPFPPYPMSLAPTIAGIGIVAAVLYFLAVKFAFPARLANAGQPHAWDVEPDAVQQVASATD